MGQEPRRRERPLLLGDLRGAASEPGLREAVEDAQVLVIAGVQFTDLNSGFFTQQITRTRTIELGPAVTSVAAATFAPVAMDAALRCLTGLVTEMGHQQPAPSSVTIPDAAADAAGGDAPLTQVGLWSAVAASLRPGDTVLADQGTAFFGMVTHRLRTDVTFMGQSLWASIGYTLPALLGACLAQPGRRGVLLIGGDGAAQMTVQELSTVLREGLTATVVIVDNDGYTVERAIHGPEEPYNDIARWDWSLLPALFAPDRPAHVHRVRTAAELAAALQDAAATPDGLTLIQAVLERMDVPELLSTLARAASSANARASSS